MADNRRGDKPNIWPLGHPLRSGERQQNVPTPKPERQSRIIETAPEAPAETSVEEDVPAAVEPEVTDSVTTQNTALDTSSDKTANTAVKPTATTNEETPAS